MNMNSVRNIFNKYPDAAGWVRGGVIDVMPGNGVTIDKTDPEYPVISSTGGGDGDGLWAVLNNNITPLINNDVALPQDLFVSGDVEIGDNTTQKHLKLNGVDVGGDT
jgi:hypothetical protein